MRLESADLAERTLGVVAVIEAVAAPVGVHPVVVGGMAVYFWTASEEFVTYDIDVVMAVSDELATKLGELGFIHAGDGRHWILEGTEVLLEAPIAAQQALALLAGISVDEADDLNARANIRRVSITEFLRKIGTPERLIDGRRVT